MSYHIEQMRIQVAGIGHHNQMPVNTGVQGLWQH